MPNSSSFLEEPILEGVLALQEAEACRRRRSVSARWAPKARAARRNGASTQRRQQKKGRRSVCLLPLSPLSFIPRTQFNSPKGGRMGEAVACATQCISCYVLDEEVKFLNFNFGY